jgi:hypothetical protein
MPVCSGSELVIVRTSIKSKKGIDEVTSDE